MAACAVAGSTRLGCEPGAEAMTARHPEIGERVAQRAHARGLENEWVLKGRCEDLLIGPDPRPVHVLQSVSDPDQLWTVKGLSAEGFWQEFVRIP